MAINNIKILRQLNVEFLEGENSEGENGEFIIYILGLFNIIAHLHINMAHNIIIILMVTIGCDIFSHEVDYSRAGGPSALEYNGGNQGQTT